MNTKSQAKAIKLWTEVKNLATVAKIVELRQVVLQQAEVMQKQAFMLFSTKI